MVRAMDSTEEYFDIFKNNKIVAVGWSEVDFTSFSGDISCLRDEIYRKYYQNTKISPISIGRKLNAVERFTGIKKGDYIVVPYGSQILLAVSKGEFLYNAAVYEKDVSNQLCVDYVMSNGDFKTVPRTALSEGLQRRLRVPGNAVALLEDFNAEIVNLVENEETFENSIYEAMQKEVDSFKKRLLEIITAGESNLQAGGVGLEQLVQELMKCDGYDTKILSKRKFPDGADADVAAKRTDRYGERSIYLQVKHHSGESGITGIRQLIKIMEDPQYVDYEFVFVTSASLSSEASKLANDYNIKVVDGDILVEWIMDNVNKLPKDMLLKLRISNLPHIVEV